jgi:hypothetical protein
MSLTKYLAAGLRMVGAACCLTREGKFAGVMIQYREADLDKAEKKGLLPEGVFEYSCGLIELRVQGKLVSKTRKQWADFICGGDEADFSKRIMGGFPFRSYHSDMTKGVRLHQALLDLATGNQIHPDLPLEDLSEVVNRRSWKRLW